MMRRAKPQRSGSPFLYVQLAACSSPGISGPYSKLATGRRKGYEKLRKDRPTRKRGAALGGARVPVPRGGLKHGWTKIDGVKEKGRGQAASLEQRS
jgi:hypothetical protein